MRRGPSLQTNLSRTAWKGCELQVGMLGHTGGWSCRPASLLSALSATLCDRDRGLRIPAAAP